MREIKFRAWDKDGKEMIEANGFYQKADPKISGNGLHLSDFLGINKDGTIGKEHENIVLMQYTGLKDKNGKEIYEGDILKCERDYWETPRNLVVEWNEDCWSLLKTDDPVDSEVLNHNSSFNVPEYQREVIGNIYENPELVERKL